MIPVTVRRDRMHGLELTPGPKIQRKIDRHLSKHGVVDPAGSAHVYSPADVEHFLETQLNPAQRRDVENGWDVTIQMDPWDFGHYVGYGFHEVIEP